MPDDDGTMTADHYDGFAESYARENDNGLFNAHYARPAVVSLAGDVARLHVLEAGCGSGSLAEDLRDGGARITAFDSSPAMLRLARQRLGEDTPLSRADLCEPLPYDSGTFDLAVASLVLHYFEDWTGPLAELRRVLRPDGRLIVVVNHPMIRPVVYPDEDYFAITPYTEDYEFDGTTAQLTFWHRPLHAMADAFTRAGFRIAVISEPPFSPETPLELLPPDLGDRTSFVCFLFFVLEAA